VKSTLYGIQPPGVSARSSEWRGAVQGASHKRPDRLYAKTPDYLPVLHQSGESQVTTIAIHKGNEIPALSIAMAAL
jgi:hypothetical protein